MTDVVLLVLLVAIVVALLWVRDRLDRRMERLNQALLLLEYVEPGDSHWREAMTFVDNVIKEHTP